MPDPNLGVLLSTTLKNYRDTLVDNIFKSNAIFFELKRRGRVKEESGGERITVPLMYAKNDTAKSYAGYDTLDTTPQTGIDAAEFNWKQYSASITISGEEQNKNAGTKHKIIDLLDAKTEQARMSLVEKMTTDIYTDGTGNASKNITGLVAMVATTGTYGAIDSAVQTWWQAQGVDTSTNAVTLAEMRNMFNSPAKGGTDTPNLVVTTQTIFETYESLLTATVQTQSEATKKVGDAGFQALEFKGVPVVYDELCNSGVIYFLNLKHLGLTVHENVNFKTSDFKEPEDQDALVAQIKWMGNLTCDRRASFSKGTNKS